MEYPILLEKLGPSRFKFKTACSKCKKERLVIATCKDRVAKTCLSCSKKGPKKTTSEYIRDNLIVLPNGCWKFHTKPEKITGYTVIRRNGKNILGHRFMWKEMDFGNLIPGLELDHVCRNRYCINPNHMRQITHRENVLCGVGAPAKNSTKTHCKRGHKFSPENLRKTKRKNVRVCLTCTREYDKIYQKNRRKKARALRIGITK